MMPAVAAPVAEHEVGRSERFLRGRLAWLPIPLLLIAIVAARVAGLNEPHPFDGLRLVLSVVFYTLVSVGTLYLIGRSFLACGEPGLLLLECGVVLWSLAGTVGDAVDRGNQNVNVTIFNLVILLAGMCHLGGAILGLRPKRAMGERGLWLGMAVALALGAVWMVAWAARAAKLPVFFVPGEGGTAVRYWVLSSSIALFSLCAGLLYVGPHGTRKAFVAWYGRAMLLLAVGLFGIMVQLRLGSVVNWLARTAQWMGGLYLLVAAVAAMRETGWRPINLGGATGGVRYRYGVAVAIVLAATAVRLAFLQSLETRAAFVTFFPAVVLAAMYGGMGPGLLATGLSALVAGYFWIEPVGRPLVASSADFLSVGIFMLSGGMVCWIAQAMHHARTRAIAAEAEAALAVERQRGSEALRESERRFRTMADAIPQLAWIASADGFIRWYNRRWYEYTGATPREMEGWGWQSVHDPKTLPAVLERWKASIVSGEPFDMTFPLRGADGVFRLFLTRVQPLKDAEGGVVQWFGTNTDVEELKRAEEALRLSNEELAAANEELQASEEELAAQNRTLVESQEALRASNERLQRVLEIETVGVIFWDLASGRMTDANDAFLKMMGYSRREVEAGELTWQKLTLPEYMEASLAEIGKFKATGRVGPYEKEYLRKDGTRQWLLFAGSSLGGSACVEFCVDITDRKQAEEELKKLNRTLRALSNSNQAVTRATDEASLVREACEIIVRDCGHRLAWVGYARENEGRTVEPVAWAGVGADYVQTAQITWADDERGRGPTGTAIRTGKVFVCNSFATNPRFGPWREEAARRGYASSVSLPLLAEGKAFGALMIYSDQPAPFSVEEVRLLTELADDLSHGIVMLRLRHAHARATEDLMLAKQAAESASRAKDQFIAVLSHELRTPLTPAVAALSLLMRDVRLPHDVREDLEMVNNNIGLEVRLIADLLDVSRIISGKLHLEKRPMNVADAIREAVRIVSGDVDAKGQSLTVEMPGEPYLIFADAARLQQVFWNLLRNSIKFSPTRSRIVVRARLEAREYCPLAAQPCPVGLGECPLPQADENRQRCEGNLVIQVIDQGSGIAPEMLPRLFNAFEQEEKSRSFGGLGLGLSICKAVVEMHGGAIRAQSEGIGCGATFTIHLPVAQCPKVSAAKPVELGEDDVAGEVPQDGSRSLRILLVEDHAETAKLMRRLLMAEGHQVTTAGTVAAGLAAARKQKPDMLISDLGLPDGSGLDLMRQLLAEGCRIPAVALSGFGTAADIEQSRAAGFAEHLVKPLSSTDALTSAIARLARE